ncbi:MAG: PTS sugar transporter subunit IIA [Kiritimatiellia bacterium]|nr:PTS sugar transporter subunit IIA [Kiritimatiellia bacterium]
MKKIINQLVQWQDLLEARSQQEALTPGARLSQLEEAILAMRNSLEPGVVEQFCRIQKKNRIAIVPVHNKVCTGCGIGLPISLVHSVHAAKELYRCPNCSRFLFYPEAGTPRRTADNTHPPLPAQVGIARFSSPDLMIIPLAATDGEQAIGELCACLEAQGFVDQGAKLAEEALKREAIVSTALDIGVAFPHVRGVEGGGLALAVGISPKGIHFQGGPKTPIQVVFFFAIPTAASAFYLHLLSGLTRVFGDGENRTKLVEAGSPAALWKALVQTTRRAIP